MSLTPEFGEEEVVAGRERRITNRSDVDATHDQEAGSLTHDLALEERELLYIDAEDNGAHAAGKVCERCNRVLTATDDARRLVDGNWVHEFCPPHPSTSP